MTEAEMIAKKLTAAQVRALRDPNGCDIGDFDDLCYSPGLVERDPTMPRGSGFYQTELGLAVLAALSTP